MTIFCHQKLTDFVIFGQTDVLTVQIDLLTCLKDRKPLNVNDFASGPDKHYILWFKIGKPDHVAGL
jgi:hypothetical protein